MRTKALLLLLIAALGLNFQTLKEFHFSDLNGKTHSIKEYRGKFTLLLFYNPANKISADSLTFFDELSSEHKALNFLAVCVACNRKVVEEKVTLEKLPLYFAEDDLKSAFNVEKSPTLLILTPDLGIYKVLEEPTPGDMTAEANYVDGLKITVKTVSLQSDVFIIKGTLYETNKPILTPVLMLHMMNKSRKDYRELASDFAYMGSTVLTIDFRGHGDSVFTTTGEKRTWSEFSPTDFVGMVNDGKVALEYLLKVANAKKCYVIGASIGANVALNLALRDEVAKVVALSPGLNYRSVRTDKIASSIHIPVMLVASRRDAYAYFSSVKLHRRIKGSTLITYAGGYHGTDILNKSPNGPELRNKIINFLFEKDVEWQKETQ